MPAKRGPKVLFCMPDRTNCILLVSVMCPGLQFRSGLQVFTWRPGRIGNDTWIWLWVAAAARCGGRTSGWQPRSIDQEHSGCSELLQEGGHSWALERDAKTLNPKADGNGCLALADRPDDWALGNACTMVKTLDPEP
jgi:hypothetical protein